MAQGPSCSLRGVMHIALDSPSSGVWHHTWSTVNPKLSWTLVSRVFIGGWSHGHIWLPTWLTLVSSPFPGQADTLGSRKRINVYCFMPWSFSIHYSYSILYSYSIATANWFSGVVNGATEVLFEIKVYWHESDNCYDILSQHIAVKQTFLVLNVTMKCQQCVFFSLKSVS